MKCTLNIRAPRQQPEDEYYYYPPAPPPPTIPQTQKIDLFNDLDKTAYIVIFVAFILGFFIVKTMQPVILRPGSVAVLKILS